MLFEECVRGRRSVRKFSDQDISQSVLEEIVDLARFSPSWKNTQVPRYHVIKNPQIKEEIARNCVLNFDFNAKTILRCKALVLVTVVEKLSGYEPDGSFSTSQGDRWEMFDAGIATQYPSSVSRCPCFSLSYTINRSFPFSLAIYNAPSAILNSVS